MMDYRKKFLESSEYLLVIAAEQWFVAQGCTCVADAVLYEGPYPNRGTVTLHMDHIPGCALAE